MSPQYRIEREQMPPGSTMQTFRVIRGCKSGWATVQAGLTREEADDLLRTLRVNAARIARRTGIGGGA